MKFSYSLLKKFAPKLPAKKELAEQLAFHAFEVESVEGDVMDIKLLPNRYSDAASHIGMAREAAAVCGVPFEDPVSALVNLPAGQGMVSVAVENPKLCPRYAARVFDVPAKLAPLPAFVLKTLEACGIASINPIVDVMNYVMLETGQPLHAFDAERIHGGAKKELVVRKAQKGERLSALDDKTYELTADMLVIADRKSALALAGIKGGKESGVTKRTRRIIVEAANFDGPSIFKTSRALGLVTDAAARFSHGMSPALVDRGMDRATALLAKLGATLVDSVDAYPKPIADAVVEFDSAAYARIIGAPIDQKKAERSLRRLGFTIIPHPKAKPGVFLVRVPSVRTDIEDREDVIDEVARLEGYTKLKPVAPLVSLKPIEEEGLFSFRDNVRTTLAHLQCDEILTHSFVSERAAEHEHVFGWEPAKLENPLSAEYAYLRPGLRGGVLDALVANARHFDALRVFEIGKVFGVKNGELRERLSLGIGIAVKGETESILELKGVVDELCASIGVLDYTMREAHGALRIEVGSQVLGYVQHIPDIAKKFHAAYAELDLEKIADRASGERIFVPLPKYPSVVRDISLLIPGETRVGVLLEAVRGMKLPALTDVDVIDEYVDARAFAGKRSVTVRFVFQSDERTLTDKEVSASMAKAEQMLKKEFRVEVR